MAFPAAAGYNNLPRGNFSPVIYSKQVQLAFRKKSVCDAVTNNQYFGEISGFGDSVRILLEPEITIKDYARGTNVEAQDLIDEDFTLLIDQAKYWSFQTDDIEEKHSHVNWQSMASNRAAYRLADNYDQHILGYMSGYKQAANNAVANAARVAADIPGTKAVDTADDDELLASMKLDRTAFANLTNSGSAGDSIPTAVRLPGETSLPTDTVSPLMIINRMARKLDQQNVPKEGRFLILDPVFKEMLMDEGSRLVNADYTGQESITNGMIANNFYGFRVYESNNLPSVGTGPGTASAAAQSSNFGVLIAGHENAVATAEQLTKTESFRSQTSFGDVVRGMHVFGRKILRPEALTRAIYNVA